MAIRYYLKPNKKTLVGWFDKTLDKALTSQDIISSFKVCRIWPFKLKAMENKIALSTIYIRPSHDHNHKEEKRWRGMLLIKIEC